MVSGTWKLLKHIAITDANGATEIDSGTFDKHTMLRVIVYIIRHDTNGMGIGVQFNDDGGSGNKYTYRNRANGSVAAGLTSKPEIFIDTLGSAGVGSVGYGLMDISNEDDKEKMIFQNWLLQRNGTGNNSPSSNYSAGKWQTTSGQISSIQITNGDGYTGKFAQNSFITIYGAETSPITDEKQTLADATVTTESSPTTSTTNNGTETNGATNANRVEVNQLTETIPAGAVITKIRVKDRADESSTNTKLVLYQDNGSTTPTTLLAYTAQFNPNVSDGWYEANIAYDGSGSSASSYTVTSSTAGRLWVGIWADGDSSIYKSSGTQKSMSLTYSGSTTAPTSTFSVSDTYSVDYNFGIVSTTTITSSAAPPANTRYEEIDTRKIYRFVDTTPVLWSATNQTWTQTGTTIALSGSTFTATNSADNSVARQVSNEQTALSTDWVCDFEYQTSDSDMNMFPLIIGNTNAVLTASNFDRVHIEGAGNASNFLRLKGMVGGSALTGDNSITGVSGTQYYGRIVKNALVVTLKIYGSSSDRENGTNQVSNTSTITFSSTPADFKFYQVSGRGDGGGGQMSWVTKNVEIYDGVTSPKSWKERGSA